MSIDVDHPQALRHMKTTQTKRGLYTISTPFCAYFRLDQLMFFFAVCLGIRIVQRMGRAFIFRNRVLS